MRGLAAPLIKLGIFIVTTVLAVSVLAVAIANYLPTGGNTYKARFTDVTSMNVGDEVRIAGVRVGSVTGLKVVDRSEAEVEFRLRPGIELPADVQAAIRYRHLAGQRYLLLNQGDEQNGQLLEPDATIPNTSTKDAVNLTVLFNGFRPLFETLQPEDVNRLADQIIQIFQGEAATITQLVANVGTLTNAIADRDAVIGAVVNNLNSVLERVNEHDDDIRDMVSSLDVLVSGLSDDRETVGSAFASLASMSEELNALLEPSRPSIQGNISAIDQLAGNLNTGRPAVESAIQNLPVKLERFGKTASYGSWFSMYLCGIDLTLGPGSPPTRLNLPTGLPQINQPIYTNAATRCQPGGIQ
ncbi:MCE family protein [Hoyosella subflava]|uniref:Putative Mce family protein n=1 Tax=Hoyosella subflava (strain DSM 45089 / JCM 17490 / NBRC 109087 / DQS3-9A1) TaxID=443218 RepID=F6EHT2_HOYSD|nr:MlaD family protein [Hoyosella subflava]AEF38880.1 Putative Mce family protein [Hoyosella subflava DQS3-9A1]